MPGGPECNKPNQEWRAPPRLQPEQQANPLVAFLREQRGEGERSHEEMVASIRSAMEKRKAMIGDYSFDPVTWMHEQIIYADTRKSIAENIPVEPLGASPYAKLTMAWALIASSYVKPMNWVARGNMERGIKKRAEVLGQTIILDPMESKLLHAMAEAVGIPNPFGPKTPKKQEPK
jgi:hypothetical protein